MLESSQETYQGRKVFQEYIDEQQKKRMPKAIAKVMSKTMKRGLKEGEGEQIV